jgi:defect-in-organelle-trafficking protein DotC
VRKHHDAQLQFADAVFTILAPAKFAVTPPNWRNYLYIRVARPEPPDATLLPNRDQAAEVALWERSVEKGWRRGVDQANRMFTIQLNRLERDLLGMALYRELLAKGMLTAPRLTEELRGVTTDGPTLMVNDRLLEIVENTRFVANDQRWKPYPTRPYRPPKHRPEINLRILPDTPPAAAAPAPVVSVPFWEKAFWDR